MADWKRQNEAEQLQAWGLSADTLNKIPEDAKASDLAVLVVPQGTAVERIHLSYTRSEIHVSDPATLAGIRSAALNFTMPSEQPNAAHKYRLNWQYGADLPSVTSLAEKGCMVYFDIPSQSGDKISFIQNGAVYPQGVTVIRLYLQGTHPLPSVGAASTVDFELSSDCTGGQMGQVFDWLNGRLV